MSSRKGLIGATAAIGLAAFFTAAILGANNVTPPLPSGVISREAIMGTLAKARFVPRSVFLAIATL